MCIRDRMPHSSSYPPFEISCLISSCNDLRYYSYLLQMKDRCCWHYLWLLGSTDTLVTRPFQHSSVSLKIPVSGQKVCKVIVHLPMLPLMATSAWWDFSSSDIALLGPKRSASSPSSGFVPLNMQLHHLPPESNNIKPHHKVFCQHYLVQTQDLCVVDDKHFQITAFFCPLNSLNSFCPALRQRITLCDTTDCVING